MRDCCSVLSTGLIALTVCGAGIAAPAQQNKFVAPAGALQLEGTGSFVAYRPGFIQILDSKMDLWLLRILPQTTITVEGEAEPGYLRPGLSIQFDGKLNRKSAIADPISEIKLLKTTGKPLLGLFPAGKEGDRIRPVRRPKPGAYCIKGKLASFKDGRLIVSIGGRRITGTLSDEVTIKFKSDDPSAAMVGDSVKMKAWYFANARPNAARNIPGKAIAENITITLAKPLTASGRKTRR